MIIRLRFLASLAFATVASSQLAPLHARSLFPNGGFEDDLVGWSLFAPANTKSSPPPAFAVSSEAAHSGRNHLRLSSLSPARFAAVAQPAKVAPGERYRVSAWVKVGQNFSHTAGPLVRITFRESAPSTVETSMYIDTGGRVCVGVSPTLPRPDALPKVWQKLEAVIEVPARSATAKPALFAWGTLGTVDYDDFSMERVSPSTSLSIPHESSAATDIRSDPKTIEPLPTDRLKEVLSYISARPQNVVPPSSDRAYWEKVAGLETVPGLLKSADELLGTTPPVLTEELYNDFAISGMRRPYEVPNSIRTNRLLTLVLAECIAPNQTRLEQIVREVEGVLDEPTWSVPAHNKRYPDWHAAREFIDLAASARGWTLANIDWLLAERLPRAIRERIRKEVGERILAPWIESVRSGKVGALWWMKAPMNWSAVCNSGVLGSALLLLEDPRARAEYLVAWEQLNPFFLNGFTPDGYCAEGVGYWSYGFGHFLMASQLVQKVTGGRVDPFDSDQVRTIMKYGSGFEIDNQHYPAFSDTTLGTRPDRHLLEFAASRYGIGKLRGQPAFKGSSSLGGRIHVALFDLALDRSLGVGEKQPPLPLRTWFPNGGALISRSSNPGQGLSVAIKGGHNNEPHNHNDLGTFVVIAEGEVAISEIGRDDYVSTTFGPLRYTSGVMNSFGHSVPRVAGKLQSTGEKARAVTVRTEFTSERDLWEIDLTSAYDVPELTRITRTFIFSRAGGGSLEVVDQASFSSPQAFGIAFALLPAQRWVEDGAGGYLVEGGAGRVRVVVTSAADLVRTEEPIRGIVPDAPAKGLRIGFDLARPAASVRIRTLITPVKASP